MTKKNNKALRAALVLCVLALFCAAFVGATFAKYVTADDAADTARAAKWGVSVSAGGSLFGTDYEAHSANATANKVTAATSANVHAGEKIVAPGTESDKGVIITLNGKPEVQYAVEATITDIEDIYLGVGTWGAMVKVYDVTADNYVASKYYTEASGTFTLATGDYADVQYYELRDTIEIVDDGDDLTEDKYYPIVWTLETITAGVTDDGVEYRNLATLTTALETAIDALDNNANEKLDVQYKITWKWNFEVDTDTNKKDTVLGNTIENDISAGENSEMVPVMLSAGTTYVTATDDGTADTKCNLDINFEIAIEVSQVN